MIKMMIHTYVNDPSRYMVYKNDYSIFIHCNGLKLGDNKREIELYQDRLLVATLRRVK